MKIVKESISFEKSSNIYKNLNIGIRERIEKWLKTFKINNYVIREDYTIDVIDDVSIHIKGLIKLPNFIRFNRISRSFYIVDCDLITLEGCPKYVGTSFSCSNNKLISLNGCPEYVGGDFYCGNNKRQFTKDEINKICKVRDNIYVTLI